MSSAAPSVTTAHPPLETSASLNRQYVPVDSITSVFSPRMKNAPGNAKQKDVQEGSDHCSCQALLTSADDVSCAVALNARALHRDPTAGVNKNEASSPGFVARGGDTLEQQLAYKRAQADRSTLEAGLEEHTRAQAASERA
jgi:hypothetical protein